MSVLHCSFSVTNECENIMELVHESADNKTADVSVGIIMPGETIKSYAPLYSAFHARDPSTHEIQQEFEIASDGMNLLIIPQPKQVALETLLETYKGFFSKNYSQRTGNNWINEVPRKPTKNYVLKALNEGHVQKAKSTATIWLENEELNKIINGKSYPNRFQEFDVKTLSLAPQFFEIDSFLSEKEIRFMLDKSEAKFKSVDVYKNNENMKKSDLVESKTCWLSPKKFNILSNVCNRIFDVLKLPRTFVINQTSENFQVSLIDSDSKLLENYEYVTQDDNFQGDKLLNGNNRFVSVFLPLKTTDKEIEFYIGNESNNRVKFSTGCAYIMYDMLKDGNIDKNAIYRVNKISKGEIVFAVLRIWDSSII